LRRSGGFANPGRFLELLRSAILAILVFLAVLALINRYEYGRFD
jgi:hypothetical protein